MDKVRQINAVLVLIALIVGIVFMLGLTVLTFIRVFGI